MSIVILYCGPKDEEIPVITEFEIQDESPTNTSDISITVNGTDDIGIIGWMITIDSLKPSPDDENWIENKPTTFTLPRNGNFYLHAWAKDAVGNVSEPMKDSIVYYTSTITEDWEYTYDGTDSITNYVYDAAVDSNDNLYVVGTVIGSEFSSSSFDAVIKKFDSDGNEDTTNWDKHDNNETYQDMYGNTLGGTDLSFCVEIDDNDNVYVGGCYGQGGSTGVELWWLRKFDSDGNEDTTNWDKVIENEGYILSAPRGIAIDSIGDIYFAGSAFFLYSMFEGSDDYRILKYQSDGTRITTGWNKRYDNNHEDEIIYDIEIDSRDYVYILGQTFDIVGSSSGQDWWAMRFEIDGNQDTSWERTYDGNDARERARDIVIDEWDNVYLIGSGENIVTDTSGEDWWIIKLDKDGNELWEKKIDSGNGNDVANRGVIDNYGFLYIAGYGDKLDSSSSKHDWWIKKFDMDGNELWSTQLDNSNDNDNIYGLAVDSENNLYAAGWGQDIVSTDSSCDWLIKKYIVSE